MAQLVSITSSQGRLILRSPVVSDAPNLLERLQTPSCVAYLPHLRDRKFTISGLSPQIEAWRSTSMIRDLFLVVERISDGKVIGDGGFEVVDFEKRRGELGVMLNDEEDVRGKGYAVESLRTMLDFAFGELGLESVRMGTLKGNKPLRGLVEKRFGLVADPGREEHECWYTVLKSSWLSKAK
ncbi:MAG: hypothetical protein M1827_003241 [Pycnora praestabilis]|nr:MAG: hypothetical protein M1827_003241 [Pycnora praestabilis]